MVPLLLHPKALVAAGVVVGLGAVPICTGQSNDIFEPPFRVKAGDEYIDVEVGHAAPFVYDMNGDGKRDLLVGQFGGGKLRIYHNVGTNDEPKYTGHEWFKAEHEFGTVPTG